MNVVAGVPSLARPALIAREFAYCHAPSHHAMPWFRPLENPERQIFVYDRCAQHFLTGTIGVIDELLERLYCDGVENDARVGTRAEMMLNITPATGKFLEILVAETKPKRLLEIGTSNGYSTIWLARAASQISASVVSLDHDPKKLAAAQRNIESASLSKWVALHACDAAEFLASAESFSFDFVFLDSDRCRYENWWPNLRRVLRLGTLVADNAVSHEHEFIPFRNMINSDPVLESVVLPIGKGQLVVRAKSRVNQDVS